MVDVARLYISLLIVDMISRFMAVDEEDKGALVAADD